MTAGPVTVYLVNAELTSVWAVIFKLLQYVLLTVVLRVFTMKDFLCKQQVTQVTQQKNK